MSHVDYVATHAPIFRKLTTVIRYIQNWFFHLSDSGNQGQCQGLLLSLGLELDLQCILINIRITSSEVGIFYS